ncbi:CHAT domain-containing protein/tetratricopeptide (TPR) repeat protein [Micromonospora profundi]|uniref:CHAT domain-containing protein n=1 Tax=Micromonospora profundi TaxID=1420889 RepID=UPI00143AAB9F|nr:CHAT domain-containing tetratricopeptide repeat protein [Micromonospora profundi]NJC13102.1 CHAT domain-containing protein/tetratricopeptide (TPR) repeat protein [Micromonospora profundi]
MPGERAELWQLLAVAYQAIAGEPELSVRGDVLVWFKQVWPQLRQDLETLSEDDAIVAMQTMTPFLAGLEDWVTLADLSHRGRALTCRSDHLRDYLVFTHHLGISLQMQADTRGAEQAFKEVARRAEVAGDLGLRAKALAHQAQLRRQAGEPGEAAIVFHRAAEAYRLDADELGEARTLGDLATAVHALGDQTGAERYTERARTLFLSHGAYLAAARETQILAGIRAAGNDLDGPVALFDEVIRLARTAGTPVAAAKAAYDAAHLLALHGELHQSARYAKLADECAGGLDEGLDRDVAEILEYVRTEAAVRQLATADSNEVADRLIAKHPELRTVMGLALALRSESAFLHRMAEHPDSAAREFVDSQWQTVVELARGTILPDGLQVLVRRHSLAVSDGQNDILKRIVGMSPAATLPGVRGRYLVLLAQRSSDAQQVIQLATEAAALLEAVDAPELAAGALVEAGMAWRRLRTGDLRYNKDQALSALRRALRVLRRNVDRAEWSRAMVALANAYLEYPVDRRRNLDRAVRRYTAALMVLTPEDYPEGHGTALAGLGLALSDPAMADDSQNLESARRHVEQSLQMLHDPATRSTVLLNLSHCYRRRQLGDPDANHDLALLYARQSYELCQIAGLHFQAAEAATAIGDLLATSARRSDMSAWTEAVDWYRQALESLPVEEAPAAHAAAAGNLANTLSQTPGGIEFLSDEILTLYQTTIETFHLLGDSVEASRARYNLANALSQRSSVDHDGIIALYEESIAGRPISEAPAEWAESATALAQALFRRNKPVDLDRGMALLEQANAVMPEEQAGQVQTVQGRELGRRGDWPGAARLLGQAAAAADSRYLATVLSAGQEAVLTRTAGLPREAAYALARAGQLAEAVTLIEGARARELGRLLERDRSGLAQLDAAAPRAAIAFRDAARRLMEAEAYQRGNFTLNLDERHRLRGGLADAHAQFVAATEAVRAVPGFAEFGLPPADAARQAALMGVPVIYLITSEFGSVALLVKDGHLVEAVFGALTEDELVDALRGVQSLTDDPALLPRLMDLLGERFLSEVAHRLVDADIPEVILVATGLLGVLPVHVARYWRDGKTRHLSDDVVVSFTPSARSLLAARRPDGQHSGARLIGVAQPSSTQGTLPHAAAETASVRRLFPGPGAVLAGPDATKATLIRKLAGATHVHLACHGTFDLEEPMRSGLVLADDSMLTLRELFDERPLDGVRLVVASACHSAVSDIAHAPDEAIGLPAGLVYAGAATVAGTLWSLKDRSAPLLVSRFYAYHFQGDPETGSGPMTAATAMARAQNWLRDSTTNQLNRFAEEAGLPRVRAATTFANRPEHWAPFVVVGPGAHNAPQSIWPDKQAGATQV